ncbi:MAG: DUF1887 family protein [Clostridia bacterium]|nr:DUF1887 family protein [Clostridia bacterium]
MTVIECFEHDPIDNIATCLSLLPCKLVLIGEPEDLDATVERYRAVIKRRHLPITVEPKAVCRDDINEAVEIIAAVIKTGDECVIDLSGGDGVVLAAAGVAYERYKDRYPVTLQRIDAVSGVVEDCDGDGETEALSSPKVTVGELVALYGGSVKKDSQPSEELDVNAIAPLWNAVIRDATQWNRRVGALLEIERAAGVQRDDLCVEVDFGVVRAAIADYPDKRQRFDALIRDLEQCGVIAVASRAEGSFRYKYKTLFLRQCLSKEGNVLEYKTLFEARSLRKDGRRVFSDARMGVNIDWDGVIHRPVPGGVKDTKNEIDVMLMRGLTPVFISCKNGDIKEVELYKLHTVAARFGGERARKMLIATDFCPDSADVTMSLAQRAADMGILFVPNAAALTPQGWQDTFFKLIDE